MTEERPRPRRLQDLAYDYIVQELMPVETLISRPVPLRRGSRLVAGFFATVVVPLADRTNHLVYRPPIHIYVDWELEQVLDHQVSPNARPVAQDQPVGLLLPPEFAGAPSDELEERIWQAEWELFTLLEQVAPLYDRQGLSSLERDAAARCQRAYRRLVSAEIWPLYEELNPDFFAWLRGAGAGLPPTAPVAGPFCSTCGASVAAGQAFCTACGARAGPVSSPGRCSRCGTQNAPGARFCTSCGGRLA